MEVKEAIATAKRYVTEIFADEKVSNLGLEEVEFDPSTEHWMITVAFSRPWNSPRTRAQDLLESLGAGTGVGMNSGLKRSYKSVVVAKDGQVLSMKNRESVD